VKVVGYSYPWDYLGDPAAAQRAAALNLRVVALAGQYHASRVVSPLHPLHRVVEIPHSACYVPVRAEAWRGHRLVPSEPAWLESSNTFADAQKSLAQVGVDVEAWIVLTHHDELGQANPDLVVRNAFGDRYSYALCPRAPDVLEYCLTLVGEIVSSANCRGVVLEACGPMGVSHTGVHDKSEFGSWSAASKELLSLCFCRECEDGLQERGIDVDELSRRTRTGIDANVDSPEEALGEQLAEQVANFRANIATRLRESLVERVRALQPDATITLHAAAGRWATGSFPTVGNGASLQKVTTVVANCWDDATGEAEVRSLAELSGATTNVGAYVRLDSGWSSDDVAEERITRYVTAGMSEVHLYHLGLLSRTGLRAAQRVVAASHKYP
jgi:hypothetical protein